MTNPPVPEDLWALVLELQARITALEAQLAKPKKGTEDLLARMTLEEKAGMMIQPAMRVSEDGQLDLNATGRVYQRNIANQPFHLQPFTHHMMIECKSI